jgi:hypothetical protein
MKTNAITLLVLFFALGFTQVSFAKHVKGSGHLIKETRDLSSFHALDIGGAWNIELIKSDEEKIIIETDDNIMPYVISKVSGGELEVYNKVDIINPTELNLSIYYKNIDDLNISGAAELFSSDVLKCESLKADFSGAAEITLHIEVKNMEGDFSGASKVELEGRGGDVELDISGAANFRAYGLEIQVLDLEASGAAVVKVLVLKKLTVDASGASSVRYKGSPEINVEDVSGASSFRKG